VWYRVCTANGTKAPVLNFEQCALAPGNGPMGASRVGAPQCVAGTPGVYDQIGNVWEWIDACDSVAPDASCTTEGSSFTVDVSGDSCTARKAIARTAKDRGVGFRCCAKP
jgi:formylglycine-generating enzyme required for sulfatase activity